MATTQAPGQITADSLYNLDAIKEFGLGAAALREARRKGLTVRRIGRRGFILGRDLIAFVEQAGKTTSRAA